MTVTQSNIADGAGNGGKYAEALGRRREKSYWIHLRTTIP
jgi:hypothetical protein